MRETGEVSVRFRLFIRLYLCSGMSHRPQDLLLQAFDRFAHDLYRHGLFRVRRKEIAEELVQETFLKVWKELAAGKEIQNIRAFLYTVLNHLIIDESRHKTTTSLDLLQETTGFDPKDARHDHLLEMLDGKRALQALETLDEETRLVIRLRYLDGYGPKEIAKLLHQTEGAISVRLHRGLKKLKSLV